MQELSNKIFIKIQSLLIYEVSNKNCFKNINDQNFAHFMRGLQQRFLRYIKRRQLQSKDHCKRRRDYKVNERIKMKNSN